MPPAPWATYALTMTSPALTGLACVMALLAGGCAAQAPSGATVGPGATASTTFTGDARTPSRTQAPVRTLVVSVRGNQVSPAPSRVSLARGQTLRVVITSDRDDTVHAHGFDVEKPLVAARPTTLLLTGGAPGQYEIETHHLGLRLLVVLVR